MLLLGWFGLGFATLSLLWVLFPLAALLAGQWSAVGRPTASYRGLALRLVLGELPPVVLTVWCIAWAVFAMFVPLMGAWSHLPPPPRA
jgi:hypothetical protein